MCLCPKERESVCFSVCLKTSTKRGCSRVQRPYDDSNEDEDEDDEDEWEEEDIDRDCSGDDDYDDDDDGDDNETATRPPAL